MAQLIRTPLFYLIISFCAFEVGCIIYKRTKVAFFNPLLIGIILVMLCLKLFKVNYADYNSGTQLISFFLGPATVVLAVPLYKKIKLFKEHCIPIIIGITAGTLSGIISIIFLCYLFKLKYPVGISMVPKSVTTPIGIAISSELGGIPSITVAAIILTGIIGSIIGPYLFKLFKIKDKVAVGVAFGTAAHAIGTTKAMEIGETEGAMSSLAIGIAGIIMVIVAPLMVSIFHRFI